MRELHHPILIAGAGMTGLLAALFIKQRHPDAEVLVFEPSDHAGGPFRGLELPGFGYCDRAMRLIYETGIGEFDAVLHGILPAERWHILPDNVKDIVGIYWRGELQTHSAYLDLRRLPAGSYRRCEEEILQRVGNGKQAGPPSNAAEHLESRFGPTTARYLIQVLEKLYRVPANALHACATHQPVMDRVILYGQEEMQRVLLDQKMRAVIAWPDQLTFPLKRQPPQSGLYPRRFGMTRVIDAAVDQLAQKGVQFHFNRRVAALELKGDAITGVKLDDGTTIEEPALFISANGLKGSLALLRGPAAAPPPEAAPPRCWMVFLRAVKPPNMGRLYHFWCFDEAYSTFRVTNYANYCPDARTDGGYPVCVELWSADPDAPRALARAREELAQMNILEPESITAQAAVQAPNLHALCTLENAQRLSAMREEIQRRSPRNLLTVGPFVDEGVMLLYEVSRAMCPRLSACLQSLA